MLRQPMRHEICETVTLANTAFVSDVETIRSIAKAAGERNRVFTVVIVVDTGEGREGVKPEAVRRIVSLILQTRNLCLGGIATSAACEGRDAHPESNMSVLARVAGNVAKTFGQEVQIVSGGNSSAIRLVQEGRVPNGVNHFRIGEAILCGRETLFGGAIEGTSQDAFTLEAEILQVTRESRRVGYEDGALWRFVVAVGRQDIGGKTALDLLASDARVISMVSSSDHTALIVAGAERKSGETVTFLPSYYALQGAMASPYVKKKYVRSNLDHAEQTEQHGTGGYVRSL